MVLESIIEPLTAENRPEEMIVLGFLFASISLFLALWVFPAYASFAMITFTVMMVLPLMVKLMKIEKDRVHNGERGLLIERKAPRGLSFWTHKQIVMTFFFLFLGFVAAYTLWFILLPGNVAGEVFFLQINTITDINTPTGAFSLGEYFQPIFMNNLRILGLSLLFSFIFGSGAIFILAWNASVLGVAMASTFKLATAAAPSGSGSYFAAFSLSMLRYLLHGIPEILAYFLAGIAGGVIAFTVLDYKIGFSNLIPKLKLSLRDASLLCTIGVILLVIAGIIEVNISTLFIV